MTQLIETISEIASRYDAVVFDQWGVLHNGSSPYPKALGCLAGLAAAGTTLAVLSNSGKRADPNAARIAQMGFDADQFSYVMTSGEALWRDIASGEITARNFYPIERAEGDAASWAQGLDLSLTSLELAEAVLLMGLPDGAELADWEETLQGALQRTLPIYCSNPDRKSPRAGSLVISPGALAARYAELGGEVIYYGKPHLPIFKSLQTALQCQKILMIGDSLEHDITGAAQANWDSVLVGGGLYTEAFSNGSWQDTLASLTPGYATPTYFIKELA
ncbi:MAG: TIGR01459 family HAD-type hydrolase [Pseudomonadota bacterium]